MSAAECELCADEMPELDMSKFQKIKILGKGSYGHVFLAKNKETLESVAIKSSAVPAELTVADSSWMVDGQTIYIEGAGYYQVVGDPTSPTTVNVINTGAVGNAAAGETVATGAGVSPGGVAGATGATGAAGANAFTNVTSPFTTPAVGAAFNAQEELGSDFIREVSALRALAGHPDIVKMIGYNVQTVNAQIVLESAETSLSADIKTHPDKYGAGAASTTRSALYQILRGMNYMNTIGIWHRDLKPQNILVMADGKIKITDFGLAKGGPFQWVAATGTVYTLWYRAPEILIQELLDTAALEYEYGPPAEAWSVGVIMWNMLTAGSDDNVKHRLSGQSEMHQLYMFMKAFGGSRFKYCYGTNTNESECSSLVKNKLRSQLSAEEFAVAFRNADSSTTRTLGVAGIAKDSDTAALLLALLDPNPDTRISIADAMEHSYFDGVREEVNRLYPAPSAVNPDKAVVNAVCVVPTRSEVTEAIWSTIIDWLWEVMHEYRMTPGTLSLGIHILRCFFIRNAVMRREVQGYGCAALYLASRYMDRYPVAIDDMVYISSNTYRANELLRMAKNVLQSIGGQMHLPTSFTYLVEILKEDPQMNAATVHNSKSPYSVTPAKILFAWEGVTFQPVEEPRVLAERAAAWWYGDGDGDIEQLKRNEELYISVFNYLSNKRLKTAAASAQSKTRAPFSSRVTRSMARVYQ